MKPRHLQLPFYDRLHILVGLLQPLAFLSLFLCLVPAIGYAVQTPFALIDDYGEWGNIGIFTSTGFSNWVNQIFVLQAVRFRPMHDLYQAITWQVFGQQPAAHHLFRWLLVGIALWFGLRTLQLFQRRVNSRSILPYLIFCTIFLIFPNQPAAMLGPQEVGLVVFQAILIYLSARAMTQASGQVFRNGVEYVVFLGVFLVYLWFKETSLAIAAVFLFFMVLFNFQRKVFWVGFLPFAFLYLYTLTRVLWLQSLGQYGTAAMSLELLRSNLSWYGHLLILDHSHPAIKFLFLSLPVIYLFKQGYLFYTSWGAHRKDLAQGQKPAWRPTPEFTFLIFLLACFLSSFLITLTSWAQTIRYFYPSVFLIALIMAFCCLDLFNFQSYWKYVAGALVVLSCIWFVAINYYNFLYQFAVQAYNRQIEQQVLAETRLLLERNETVYVAPVSEYEDKVKIYFQKYLPYFEGKTFPALKAAPWVDGRDARFFYLARNEAAPSGCELYQDFPAPDILAPLHWAHAISWWANFGQDPYYWTDAVHIGKSNWFVYQCKA